MHTKKKQGEFFVQEPLEGPFNSKALQWRSRTAYIPYHRVKDFISGEENRSGFPTKFIQCQKHEKVPGSLKRRVDEETYLEKISYHCSYGLDLGAGRKLGEPKEEPLDGDWGDAIDCETTKRGSNKPGCLCNFEVQRLYLHPLVARLTYECFEHINLAGVLCHGTMDATSETMPNSARSPGEREIREEISEPEKVAAPGVSIHFEKYEEILRIESRLKIMLYNHPSLLIDYCSLLEDLEGKLNKALANKRSPPAVFTPPVNNIVSEFGLKVKEPMTKYPSLPSFQYPPAPPVRFSNSVAVVDWPKVLAAKIRSGSIPAPPVDWPNVLAGKISSGSFPEPAPPLGNGSDPGCNWKKILGGRQSLASIYVPPAPPMRDNPGGFDWEKALAESQSLLSRQHRPSTSGGNGSPGFGSTLKQVVGRKKDSLIYEIPPIPSFKSRPSGPTVMQVVLEHSPHDLASKRPKIPAPSQTQGQGISYPLKHHDSLSRPVAFSLDKSSNFRTSSDVKEVRDSSEDTFST